MKNNQVLFTPQEKCVVCGPDWTTKKTSYDTGAKSHSILVGVRLQTKFKNEPKDVTLMFCDTHFKHHTSYTKLVNGILKIRNLKTHKLNYAAKMGVVV